MRYVLDSNVLLQYVRQTNFNAYIEETYNPFATSNTAIISIVTVAEMLSIAKQYNWGKPKLKVLQTLFDSLVIVEIRYFNLIDVYAEIDAYSQGKLQEPTLNM